MRLLRLKITDPEGFRSLRPGFEHIFRGRNRFVPESGISPFVCAGPNGSGKSNLLEALAAIFFQLECKNLAYRPDLFEYDLETAPGGYQEELGSPDAFELEYLITPPTGYTPRDKGILAHIKVMKEVGVGPQLFLLNIQDFAIDVPLERRVARDFLPDFIVAYSSGENEILSLPFFKMRFIQFDEYLDSIKKETDYGGAPEGRLVYLDQEFNQAILLCNFLFSTPDELRSFREEIGLLGVEQFRIVLKSIRIPTGEMNPARAGEMRVGDRLTEPEHWDISQQIRGVIKKLQWCATAHFYDEESESYLLDYWVDEQTQKAFRLHFGNALTLFRNFQLLLTLNLYSVTDKQKRDLYQSNSLYFNETIPTLPSDQRVMRFKDVVLKKSGLKKGIYSKALSDGENQLVHTLGLCTLYRDTKTLFLLDEPETHFNPDWRAKFLTRINACFSGASLDFTREMLITTHAPFLISDSKPERVLVFAKSDDDSISISNPDYNTLGASINKITMSTFHKRETIGGIGQRILEEMKSRFEKGENRDYLIEEINRNLGESVEKVLLLKTILDSMPRVK